MPVNIKLQLLLFLVAVAVSGHRTGAFLHAQSWLPSFANTTLMQVLLWGCKLEWNAPEEALKNLCLVTSFCVNF